MKKAVLALAAVLALVLTAPALGDDFSQGKGAKATPNWKVSGGICHWCVRAGADEADRVVALTNGGPDTEANMRPIHSRPCQVEKAAEDRNAR